jgi:vanillate O-demethylase monooxygenase subunit
MARRFKPEDEELTKKIREGQGVIFSEDLEMLESQQRNLLNNPQRKLLKLDIDAGGVHSRRIIKKLIKAEQAQA